MSKIRNDATVQEADAQPTHLIDSILLDPDVEESAVLIC